jgi:hypothetical protein
VSADSTVFAFLLSSADFHFESADIGGAAMIAPITNPMPPTSCGEKINSFCFTNLLATGS